MKLLAITDIHDRGRYAKKLSAVKRDLTLVIGDITYFKSRDFALKILEAIKTDRPLLFVPGNCDDRGLLHLKEVYGITNIHGDKVEYENAVFIGLGGSNITPFATPIEFSEEEIWDILVKVVNNVKLDDKLLILVSHTPPYNSKVDLTHFGEHVGSVSVRRFIEEYQPALCLCGHIHEARGIDRIGNTLVVNPGPLMYKYYAIIEIKDKQINVELCKL